MANMVIPDEGKELLSRWCFITENEGFGTLQVGLYKNDYTPVNGSTVGSFTPATFTGSDQIIIDRADWNAPVLIANIAYVVLPEPPTWLCTGGGPETVYGWYLYDGDENVVIAAQRFDVARVMNTGTTESLNPFRIGLKTLD